MLEAPAQLDEARRELDLYFEGRLRDFELPLDWRLSKDFRRRALRAVNRIPYGETRTYTQVATSAGNERAVRAAGTACGSNPIPIVVPCHRVLRTGGGLGGYGGGLPMKQALLELEGEGRAKERHRRRSAPRNRLLLPIARSLRAASAARSRPVKPRSTRIPAAARLDAKTKPASFARRATAHLPGASSMLGGRRRDPRRAQPRRSLEAAGQHTFSVYAEDPERCREPAGNRTSSSATKPKKKKKTKNCEGEAEFEEREAGEGPARQTNACCAPPGRALVSSATQSRVKLAVSYTAFAPTDVDVDYELIGGRGTLELGGRQRAPRRARRLQPQPETRAGGDGEGAARHARHRVPRRPLRAAQLPSLRDPESDDQARPP